GSPDYWTNVLSPHQAERAIAYTSALLSRAAYNHHVPAACRIAYDEWNVWYRTDDGSLEERYSFDDALAVATYLNIFTRHCDWVAMANLAQMVNAIAPVVTNATSAETQPTYHPFLLHSQASLDEAVDVTVLAPTVEAPQPPPGDRWGHLISDLGPFPVLDAAATCDLQRRRVAVTIVNRSPEKAVSCRLGLRDASFNGRTRIRVLTAGAEAAGPLRLAQTQIEEGTEEQRGGRFVLALPPRSFSVVEAPMQAES
ncbi:MAG TPA: alpha-L-arabinofuranosidase C-terminal domain-containing protein, partial [Acidimicrobiales bacterium]|nr:alpha-L-arabinofuranosidase C-terminal domain-containing protein [Acidimicrobiales bacterium]